MIFHNLWWFLCYKICRISDKCHVAGSTPLTLIVTCILLTELTISITYQSQWTFNLGRPPEHTIHWVYPTWVQWQEYTRHVQGSRNMPGRYYPKHTFFQVPRVDWLWSLPILLTSQVSINPLHLLGRKGVMLTWWPSWLMGGWVGGSKLLLHPIRNKIQLTICRVVKRNRE